MREPAELPLPRPPLMEPPVEHPWSPLGSLELPPVRPQQKE